jgi:MYXO-CTERM domain-containing protein
LLVSCGPEQPKEAVAASSPERESSAGLMLAGTVNPSSLNFGNQRVATVSAPLTVTVSNTGTTTFQVTSVTISNGAPFTVSPAGAFTLAPAQSRTLSVVFTPTAQGQATGTLTLTTNDPSTPTLSVVLTGTGVKPTVVLSATSLAFGEQYVGTSSTSQSVEVANTGTDVLTVSNVSVNAGAAFSVTPNSTFTLAPNQTRQLSVVFSPPAEGPFTGTLTLTTDDPAQPNASVTLTGAGVRPILALAPTALAFGDRAVGTSGSQFVTVRNTGTTGTLRVANLVFSGSQAFTLSPNLPFDLAPGATRALTVTFAPTSVGPASASLTLQSNDPTNATASVSLSGTGVSGALQLSLPAGPAITELDFGIVLVNTTQQRAVRLTNIGQAPVTLQGPSLQPGPFTVSGLAQATLQPGAFIDFQVAFSPSFAGNFNSTLSISSNAVNSPTVLNLMGAGGRQELRISRNSVFFGDVRLSSESNRVPITVVNTGNVSATLQNMAVVGPFAVVLPASTSLPITLPAATSFTFEVVFKPTAQGLARGGLDVISDIAGAPPLRVELEGNGTVAQLSLSTVSVDFGNQRVAATSGPQPVILTNTGSAVLEITELIFSNAAFSVSAPLPVPSPNAPLLIAPGQQRAVSLIFTPNTLGQLEGKLFIISNAFTPAAPLDLRGKGVDGRLSLTPSTISFPGTAVGGPGSQNSVVLTNTGEASLTILGVSPPGNAAFALSGLPAQLVLQPNESWTFTATFTPTQRGYVSSSAVIRTDAVLLPEFNLQMEGTGMGPAVEVAPAALNFGRSNVGVPTLQAVALRNVGERDLIISNMSFADVPTGSSGAALDFSVDNATVFPLAVQPGGSRLVQVVFTPRAVGARQAKGIVYTNDRTVEVVLVGEGTSPVLNLSESNLSFGNSRVNVVSAPRILRISNTGTGPLTLSMLSIVGPDASAFIMTSPGLPVVLQPGNFTDVAVAFTPDSVRAFAAQLSIISNQPNMPSVSVPLSGTGVGSSVVRISPSSINFGQQLINGLSGPRKLRVINDTTSSVTLATLSVQGTGASQFLLADVTLPHVLAAGEELEVEVRFTPREDAEVMSTLRLSFSEVPQPSEVPLLGKGIPSVLSIRPSPVDFGLVRVGGAKSERPLTLTNLSSDPIVLATPEPTYITGEPFTYDASRVTGQTLQPGASLIVNVGYQPQAETLSETNLSFGTTTPNSPRSVDVQFRGRAAQRFLSVDPGSLNFGEVTVNQASEPQVVTVINKSAQPQRVVVMLKDAAGTSFRVEAPALADPIAAGASATFKVLFQPQQDGQSTNQVQVWLQGESQPEREIPVSGTGKAAGDGDGGEGCSCGSTDAGSAGLMGLLVLMALAASRRRLV